MSINADDSVTAPYFCVSSLLTSTSQPNVSGFLSAKLPTYCCNGRADIAVVVPALAASYASARESVMATFSIQTDSHVELRDLCSSQYG